MGFLCQIVPPVRIVRKCVIRLAGIAGVRVPSSGCRSYFLPDQRDSRVDPPHPPHFFAAACIDPASLHLTSWQRTAEEAVNSSPQLRSCMQISPLRCPCRLRADTPALAACTRVSPGQASDKRPHKAFAVRFLMLFLEGDRQRYSEGIATHSNPVAGVSILGMQGLSVLRSSRPSWCFVGGKRPPPLSSSNKCTGRSLLAVPV